VANVIVNNKGEYDPNLKCDRIFFLKWDRTHFWVNHPFKLN